MTNLSRRGLLAGLGSLIAAPAIIKTPGLLMPIKRVEIVPLIGPPGFPNLADFMEMMRQRQHDLWAAMISEWEGHIIFGHPSATDKFQGLAQV